jgi:hypothetical protein
MTITTTGTVRWICHGGPKSLAYCVGNVLCSLLQMPSIVQEDEDDTTIQSTMSPPKVEITKYNSWTESSETITMTTWWESLYQFLQHASSWSQSSQLLGDQTSSNTTTTTTVHQWIELTVQMLTSIGENDTGKKNITVVQASIYANYL